MVHNQSENDKYNLISIVLTGIKSAVPPFVSSRALHQKNFSMYYTSQPRGYRLSAPLRASLKHPICHSKMVARGLREVTIIQKGGIASSIFGRPISKIVVWLDTQNVWSSCRERTN